MKKKMITALLASAMVLSLVACGGGGTDSNGGGDTSSSGSGTSSSSDSNKLTNFRQIENNRLCTVTHRKFCKKKIYPTKWMNPPFLQQMGTLVLRFYGADGNIKAQLPPAGALTRSGFLLSGGSVLQGSCGFLLNLPHTHP